MPAPPVAPPRVKDSEDAVADQGLRLQSVESSVKDQEARVSAAEELGKNHQGSQKMDEAIVSVYNFSHLPRPTELAHTSAKTSGL